MAYKAINTLDSMIGYSDERYLYFGRAAARIDDIANYLPARLSAVCIAAASAFTTGHLRPALRTRLADARKHLSPNAGFPESAMAGALGVQLGGDAIYGGAVEHRAVLGAAERELTVDDIAGARSILRVATAIGFSFALIRLCGCESMIRIDRVHGGNPSDGVLDCSASINRLGPARTAAGRARRQSRVRRGHCELPANVFAASGGGAGWMDGS
jgi:hypothetical protein